MAADEIVAKYKLEVEQAVKNTEKLTKTFEENEKAGVKAATNSDKAFEDLSGTMGKVSPEAAKVVQGFKGVQGAIMTVTTALKTLKGALLATGLGAFVVLVGSLIAAFTKSEEGQNRWNKIMAVTGSVIGNLTDKLADLGEWLIKTFSNPKQALIDLGNLIKDNIVNRIVGMVEFLPAVGKAIKLALSGEFVEAGKVVVDATAKMGLGVDNMTGKIQAAAEATKEFAAEIAREAEIAAKVADMRAKADVLERDALVNRAKKEAEINELMMKAREVNEYTAAERKKFANDYLKLQDELLLEEKKILELRAEAIKLENTLSRTNKEGLRAEAEAIAAVEGIEARRFAAKKTAVRLLNSIESQTRAEEKARQKAKEDEEKEAAKRLEEMRKAAFEAEKARQQQLAQIRKDTLNLIAQLEDATAKTSEQLMDRQIAKAHELYDARREALVTALSEQVIAQEDFNAALEMADADLNAKIEEANKAHNDRIFAQNKALADETIKLEQERAEKSQEIRETTFQAAGMLVNGWLDIVTRANEFEMVSLENQLRAGQITREKYEDERKRLMTEQAENQKAAALLNAIVNTAAAVATALTAGPVAGQILAALTAALGAVQIGLIVSQPIPQFAEGGWVTPEGWITGRKHKQGGVKLEAEGGEFITNVRAAKRWGGLLEYINTNPNNLNGWDGLADSIKLNSSTTNQFNDRNLLSAIDRHRERETALLYTLIGEVSKLSNRPKRGGYA